MKTLFKLFATLVAVLLGIRASSIFLLMADKNSDIDVLIALCGLFAVVGIETAIFYFLYVRQHEVKTIEGDKNEK